MSFATLALISLIAILGPLLAAPRRWHLPILLGELGAGILFGPTGFSRLHAQNSTFTFMANIGFALIMFVAGSHVPVRDASLRTALRPGALRAVAVGVLSIPLALLIASVFGTGHAALYAVLITSSSAALVLPVIDSLGLGGPQVLQLLPQVAIADTACIVALPLAIDPKHAGRAALGALAVIACAGVAFVVLRYADRTGRRERVHRISEHRKFALEMRINLVILFGLAALATRAHVSIMLAGFSFGLAVAGIGEPRRLARQLFAITEGFFGPLFFVWLGASLDLRQLGHRPSFIVLGVALGVAALVSHGAMALLPGRLLTGRERQPISIAILASAQLGVPVAAVTVGSQLNLLERGEGAALILGALVTIAMATVGGALASRSGLAKPAAQDAPAHHAPAREPPAPVRPAPEPTAHRPDSNPGG
jgi:Kef-type K+ transport system membrane component KefB